MCVCVPPTALLFIEEKGGYHSVRFRRSNGQFVFYAYLLHRETFDQPRLRHSISTQFIQPILILSLVRLYTPLSSDPVSENQRKNTVSFENFKTDVYPNDPT